MSIVSECASFPLGRAGLEETGEELHSSVPNRSCKRRLCLSRHS